MTGQLTAIIFKWPKDNPRGGLLLLQMRNAVDGRENAVDVKLAEMAAMHRQIRAQGIELRALVTVSAEETGQTLDLLRSDILGELVEDTAQLVAALAVNKDNVWVVPTDVLRYLQLF